MKNITALFTLFLLLPTALSAPAAETTPPLSPSPSTLTVATHRQQPNSTPTPAPTHAAAHAQARAQNEDEEQGQPPRTSQFWLDFTKPYDPLTQAPAPTDLARPQGGGQEAEAEAVPFSQTTYYTCKTRDATITHCGWHIPITWVGEAGGERTGGGRGGAWGVGGRAVVMGTVALVVGAVVI